MSRSVVCPLLHTQLSCSVTHFPSPPPHSIIIVLMLFITFTHESSPCPTIFRFPPVAWLPLSHLLILKSLQVSFFFLFYACKFFACMVELTLNIWSHNSFYNKWSFKTAEWERVCYFSWGKESPWPFSHISTF